MRNVLGIVFLGKGNFGTTYRIEWLRLSGKRRTIKEIPELLFDEYETSLLSRLNHPAIPALLIAFSPTVWFIMKKVHVILNNNIGNATV